MGKTMEVIMFNFVIPQLECANKIAETMTSAIFQKDDKILKLTCDPASYYFLMDSLEKCNPYFPKIYKDYGQVYKENFKKYFLIEMEKLEKLTPYDQAYGTSMSIVDAYQKYWKDWANLSGYLWSLPWKIASTGDYEKELKEALNMISEYAEQTGVLPDLMKIENYMKRKDGHLVIIDPVFSDSQ